MNGLDLLQQTLIKDYHYSNAKISSNIGLITDIVKILASDDVDKVDILNAAIEQCNSECNNYRVALTECKRIENELRRKQYELDCERKKFNKLLEDAKEIMKPETPEAKDAIRRFIVFKENCNISSKYDNTAFIKGAAIILGNMNDVERAEYELDMSKAIDSMSDDGKKVYRC